MQRPGCRVGCSWHGRRATVLVLGLRREASGGGPMQDPNRPFRMRRRAFLERTAGDRVIQGSRAAAQSLGGGGPAQDPNSPFRIGRRTFLGGAAAAIVLASCGGEEPEQKTV